MTSYKVMTFQLQECNKARGTSSRFVSLQDDTDETSELWKRIQITGQVNTAVAGTYTCTYYVVDTAGNMSNSAELTVVVE